ncbi:MAG: hypothetical protein M3Z06_01290 [Actinomycetota bacterium]|nr:hypothetical protein [Actinomycetota bacterium]
MTNRQTRLHVGAAAVALAAVLLALAGCGSSSRSSSSAGSAPATPTTAGTTSTATTAGGALTPAVDELDAAEHPRAGQFPSAAGHTLQQLARTAKAAVQLGPATGVFVPGVRRIAFALNASSGAFVYAPTAIYIARRPGDPARGPYLAPADPMGVQSQYRSKQNSGPGGIKAIFGTEVPVPGKGTYSILALTRTAKGLIGATGEVAVAAASPIPDVGQRPPAVATDTLASTHGNLSLLTTRVPPESMHSVSFSAVLGKRPIALVISTPQLCVSRVCGPVTDIAVQLQREFGHRIDFIHQEVYVDNQPSKGLRPQLIAFHLQTEPWLFTINRRGLIAARLEGAYGLHEARQALLAALR